MYSDLEVQPMLRLTPFGMDDVALYHPEHATALQTCEGSECAINVTKLREK